MWQNGKKVINMNCKSCDQNLQVGSSYCNQCGTKVEIEPVAEIKIPQILTVKEALKTFFNGTISPNFLYSAIRNKKIPAVPVMGKVLLDRDELIKWWNEQLEQSKKPQTGLRKIQ